LVQLTFLGGVGTVTGSKYLLESGSSKILIDCGLFQGFKQNRLKNWAPLPCDPASVSSVVLTHAHIDHSGYLPLFCQNGFNGRVFCTEATQDLCGILLPDSAYLAEREAEFANKHGFSKHAPALPLYTHFDAENALKKFDSVPFGKKQHVTPEFSVTFLKAGHILGAAIVLVEVQGLSIVFSGDLGRPEDPIMRPPETVRRADYLVVESTYGGRSHAANKSEALLEKVILRTVKRGGTVLIPAFAVGRTQTILYYLERLKSSGRIPNMPVFMDSPMATNASDVYGRHADELRLTPDENKRMWNVATYVRDVEDSKALDRNPMPKIILSASGMATGGRVLHHLKFLASQPRNSIIFAGYQASGTRGAAWVDGAEEIKIHGDYIKVRAEVHNLTALSAHADADEIMGWLTTFESAPKQTFVTHGEPAAADALRLRIKENLDWPCGVPEYRDTIDLT